MEFKFIIEIIGIYSTPSPIGLFEGLKYYENNKMNIYYPKNKKLINKENINKKLEIKYINNNLTEELI